MKPLAQRSGTLLVIGAVLCSCFAKAQTVVLPGTASVSGETVKLSDLLPHNAPNELRRASQTIELGRAPRLGSMRAYERGQIAALLQPYPDIARVMVIPDRLVVTRPGYTIPSTAIRDAITRFFRQSGSRQNLPVAAMGCPSNIIAAEDNPSIEVRDFVRDRNKRQLQLTLACSTSAICRDFLVYVQDPGNVLAQNVPRTMLAARISPDAGDGAILIRAGRHVQMLMRGNGMQISFKVICLESGRAGQTVHVRSSDSRQILQAEVVSGDLVWSRLEL